MRIEKLVYAALAADAGVTALCPATRILPDDETQNFELPLIKHFVVADKSIHTHQGRVTLRDCEFYQVSCYAASIKAAATLADAVIDALDGTHLVGSPEEPLTGFQINQRTIPYDPDVRCAGIQIDFEFWYGN